MKLEIFADIHDDTTMLINPIKKDFALKIDNKIIDG